MYHLTEMFMMSYVFFLNLKHLNEMLKIIRSNILKVFGMTRLGFEQQTSQNQSGCSIHYGYAFPAGVNMHTVHTYFWSMRFHSTSLRPFSAGTPGASILAIPQADAWPIPIS